MEIDGDGCIDILSGSYSRHDPDMAGLFQVLRGRKDGTFGAPEVLNGDDGNPLVITPRADGEAAPIGKICTRPTAVDLDGDRKVDIVSGNFDGTFAFFRGAGGGKFAAKNTWLEADGQPLRVEMHSDPFFVDWDKDGDLDLLSGSAAGGVFLFRNIGTVTQPKFAPRTTLLEPKGHVRKQEVGEAHVTGPQADTRVWVDDVNGDGKLDLLVGDSVSLVHPAKGVDQAEAEKRLTEFAAKQEAVYAKMRNDGKELPEAQMEAMQKELEAIDQERAKFLTDEMTGFVWLLLQK